MKRLLLAIAVTITSTLSFAQNSSDISVPQCMVEASDRYSVPLRALIAVWLTEGGTIGRTSQNTNKTEDHGPMQINTVWIKRLNKDFGITREMITNDFCWNVMSAAYILRYEINLAGGSIWDGIGHYHSRTPKYKYPYIQRVYKNSLRF
ncbi:lytic transglycosylase domain-containing protein [Acinetobacter junii]|uniref:lytic transglycosylase domain-containing protein n=1 Tax=Acinetobacter junii TaxID=40215 RepID=UPI0002CD99A4|nr:lytic transglycosylase domain-containing protein [Acinetobacter junii]ENV52079.1 hypothetical protein F953_00491 [Acinetobacter junii CIP 107470 = MTCC 11364]